MFVALKLKLEFATLRPKTYSYLTLNNNNDKTKGKKVFHHTKIQF